MICIRQSEGSSPQGYTLQEACLLARSSVTKQRVLALRILAAVLAAARPQASHQQAAGILIPQPVNLPLHLSNNHNLTVSSTIVQPCCNRLHMCALHACICRALHLHGSESKWLWDWSHSDSSISVRVWLTSQNQQNSKNLCPLAFRKPLRQPLPPPPPKLRPHALAHMHECPEDMVHLHCNHNAAAILSCLHTPYCLGREPHASVQAKITWFSVWEYALQEVQVATVLRRLLDDAHMSVVTAAAEAMAMLVGPGPEEEEVWEAAQCNPGTGKWTCDCTRMMTKRQGTDIIA